MKTKRVFASSFQGKRKYYIFKLLRILNKIVLYETIASNCYIKKGDKRQQPTQCRCLNVYFLAIYFTL